MYIYDFTCGQRISYIFFLHMKKKTIGGKREGAGRPSQGKRPVLVTLNGDNVDAAKKREKNFSGLLDGLLADWLNR